MRRKLILEYGLALLCCGFGDISFALNESSQTKIKNSQLPINMPKSPDVSQKEIVDCGSIPLQDCIAAKHGFPKAQEALGYMYIAGDKVKQDYKEAAKWLGKAAKQNIPSAQYNLGLLYSEGKGVPEDEQQAFYWINKAAKKKYMQAEHELGVRYFKGIGTKQSYKKAFKWYQASAEHGNVNSQIVLGFMYALRKGVNFNPLKAYAWLTLGLENGEHEEDAKELQQVLYDHMNDNERQQSKKLAQNYLTKYKVS